MPIILSILLIQVILFILPILLILFLFYASYSIGSGIYLKAFCRAKTSQKVIALSFDDGHHPRITPKVLDVLAKHDIKAIFFLIGEMAEKYPEIVKRIINEGHLIGNHSYTHNGKFPILRKSRMESDLKKCESVLTQITNQEIKYFRPPYGVTNPTIGLVARKLGYKTIGWSIRSLDTKKESRTNVLMRIKRLAHPGGIILMHDNREECNQLTEKVINHLSVQGYKFIRVDELMEIRR